MFKKILLSVGMVLIFTVSANAEAWIPNYGYFENGNEKSAKTEVINNIAPKNIFDFNTSPNAGGESIKDGKYYVPIMYNGGYNGTDTDYLYLDELKGDKGDTGATGAKGDKGATGATGSQGIQGERGLTGATGEAGRDGTNGLNGTDGKDGLNGIDGAKGDKGDTGEQGVAGQNGVDGENGEKGNTGSQGEQGIQGLQGIAGEVGQAGVDGLNGATGEKGNTGDTGVKGDTGKQGERGLQGERGKGLENRVEILGEIRVLDTRKTTTSIYAGRDINNNVNIVGVKFTYKLGRSYYERKIDELEAKVNNMTSEESTTQTIVKDKDGNVVSMHISNNDKGVSFTHSF